MLVGKPLVAFLIVWALRHSFAVALTVAAALAQIGEFSFILSAIGRDLGLLSHEVTNAVVAISILSIVLNALAFRTIGPIERWVAGRPRLRRLLDRPRLRASDDDARRPVHSGPGHRAVVVGYGPTGRTLTRLLRENAVEPTIIELNLDTVRTLRTEGVDAVYGDATRPETLLAAGVASAGSLLLTSAGMASSPEVIRAAREINPAIRVLARAASLRGLPPLQRAGADTIYSGEGEVALAFVEDILGRLGATAEQIDRERARAREELSGKG